MIYLRFGLLRVCRCWTIRAAYTKLWDTKAVVSNPEEVPEGGVGAAADINHFGIITYREVSNVVKRLKVGSATGVDHLNKDTLSKKEVQLLLTRFTVWS